jgi:hypothetical protein
MPLYLVQDDDRPLFVIADDFPQAISKWKKVISDENEGDDAEPAGVHKLADDHELVVENKPMKPLGGQKHV